MLVAALLVVLVVALVVASAVVVAAVEVASIPMVVYAVADSADTVSVGNVIGNPPLDGDSDAN